MNGTLDHLLDGREVVVPLALAGHYPRMSSAASPVVSEILLGEEETPPHPYSGGGCVLARLATEQQVIVATERLAHRGACIECAPVWERLQAAFEGVPDGASLTAGVEVLTDEGPALLVVDVFDLPNDFFEDEKEC